MAGFCQTRSTFGDQGLECDLGAQGAQHSDQCECFGRLAHCLAEHRKVGLVLFCLHLSDRHRPGAAVGRHEVSRAHCQHGRIAAECMHACVCPCESVCAGMCACNHGYMYAIMTTYRLLHSSSYAHFRAPMHVSSCACWHIQIPKFEFVQILDLDEKFYAAFAPLRLKLIMGKVCMPMQRFCGPAFAHACTHARNCADVPVYARLGS